MKPILILLLIALVAGCARRTPPPVGLADWSEVRRAADEFVLEAKPKALLQSADTTGFSKELWSAMAQNIQGWSQAKLRHHHAWTKEVSPDEHQRLQMERRKDWPEEMGALEPGQWNHPPDRIIVYRFENREEKKEYSITFAVGAYQQDKLWYFALQL